MTGQELFHALSFVDERYIMEAERASFRKIPWMKVLSVAACLCIVLAGAFALSNMGMKSAAPEAEAPAAAAPEAAPMAPAPEAAPEAAPPMPEEEFTESAAVPEPPLPFDAETASGELQHIPYARVQVVKVLEDGSFEAIVEADEPMEMDTQVTVVVDPSKVPGADPDAYTDLISVVEGVLIEIEDGAYDPEENILYIAKILFIDE